MFIDRYDAGQKLASLLIEYNNREDQLILALPRGGVPVASEIAAALNSPLDIFIVRKLGLPWHEELAMGAIAQGDVTVLNDQVVNAYHISQVELDAVIAKEKIELQRRNQTYRQNKPYPEIENKHIILVDDGIATGATMKAAIKALTQLHCKSIIVAVPVAPPDTVLELQQMVQHVFCVMKPRYLMAIGQFYRQFNETTDYEVISILNQQWMENKS